MIARKSSWFRIFMRNRITSVTVDDLVLRISDEHPETIFQAIMYAICGYISKYRVKGKSDLAVFSELLRSLEKEMEIKCNTDDLQRKPYKLKVRNFNWKKSKKIGNIMLANQPSTQKDGANYYSKIVVGWAFICPRDYLNFQMRVKISDEDSDIDIAQKIVEYFRLWLSDLKWQD